jgi:ATP-dependent RNA helicase SUPV3L1/SUV3
LDISRAKTALKHQRLQRKVVQHTAGCKYQRKYAFCVWLDVGVTVPGLASRDASPACPVFFKAFTVTTPSKPLDLANLDPLTVGIFQAATSGDRSARLREWLQTGPSEAALHEVYRELSSKDKGVAKQLKEKIDEIKRSHGQEALASDWAQKAELILSAPRLNMADALAWQRDAAKAGAPLSREPLASLKVKLVDVVKGVEDLQHQVMVQRESAVLLAQRIEVLSTKPIAEAQHGQTGLQNDVAQWQTQAQALTVSALWPSVDLKYPNQLDAAGKQMQAVWDGFSAALALANEALGDASAALPPVPVWADEIRRQRGEVVQAPAGPVASVTVSGAEKSDKSDKPAKPKIDPAQRQAMRELATNTVTQALESLEKQLTESQGAPLPESCATLHSALKTHGKNLDTSLDERLHKALTAAGDAQGWQRWLADQVRLDLVTQAEALLDANKAPTVGGRKLQDKLRQLRDAWKQMDQGGLPNHALWKRFDAACNEAYKAVLAWLEQMKKDSADQRAQRLALMEEVKAWTVAQAESEDWRAQLRALHQFADRWRNAGHLSEKAFGEMQGQWKGIFKAAAARLEAAQKASIDRRQALIQEAQQVGAAPALRVDAVKALQQRWQVEAQSVPLDRKTEQKLWEVFRAPLDEAFQRKGTDRPQAAAPLNDHDRAVIEASKALDAANASGDVAKIRSAMAALDAALRGQALQAKAVQPAPVHAPVVPAAAAAPPADQAQEPAQDSASVPASDAAPAEEAHEGAAPSVTDAGSENTPASAPAAVAKPAKPVVAVRGDDRPGQKRTEAPTGRDGRRDARPGERGARPGADRGPGRGGDRFADRAPRGDFREERGPRLGDAAFRAQREAMERAEMSLRKLAAQAHGETLTRLMSAWQSRQNDALPTAQELGKAVSAPTRQAWVQALGGPAKAPADTALLRLEMAAEVPTPADQLNARRALQLQLLTQRNQPGPTETWAQDVAQVLSGPHEEATARRLQNALKNLLRS